MRIRLELVLGRRLRELAEQRAMPLSHLADRAGIARSHFWLILDGEVSTSLGVIQKLADVLAVPPVTLLVPEGGDATTEHNEWLGFETTPHVYEGGLLPNPAAPRRVKTPAKKKPSGRKS